MLGRVGEVLEGTVVVLVGEVFQKAVGKVM